MPPSSTAPPVTTRPSRPTNGGVTVGALLAVGLNLWMVTQFEMSRFPLTYVAVGVVAVLALGQAAVLAPALRAARVSPVEATRSV